MRSSAVVAFVAAACGSSPTARTPDGGPLPDASFPDGPLADARVDASADAGATCVGGASGASTQVVDGTDHAEVTTSGDPCALAYHFTSTIAGARDVSEAAGDPTIRTGNALVDGLYALALDDLRQDAVTTVTNGSTPVACDCYEAGALWPWVWTRDISYSVEEAIGLLDPARAQRSLELKLSPLASGGDTEIIQDTGTGGSWPTSTDRVVWALGAWELLKFLDEPARTTFRDEAYAGLVNTIEHDRAVAFDGALYRGETSFLDWREQTYPDWVASDPARIATSRALSTNLLHLRALQIAAALATEKSDATANARYAGWAADLATQIDATFWRAPANLYASFTGPILDGEAADRYDALGEALAILVGQAGARGAQIAASYPHTDEGLPVIWPEQQVPPVYHNRAAWPFATSYFARAAALAGDGAVVSRDVGALVRDAALQLSNVEALDAQTARTTGVVTDSPRQLWSVAGFLAAVDDVLFGVSASQTGLSFHPFLSAELRAELFAGSTEIALNHLAYHGHDLTIVVAIPAGATGDLVGGAVTLDGAAVTGEITPAMLGAHDEIDVALVASAPVGSATLIDASRYDGPLTPAIDAIAPIAGGLALTLDDGGEASAVTYTIARDGAVVATNVAGPTWDDAIAGADATTHCYTVESVYANGVPSQRSPPDCWWGADSLRVDELAAWDLAPSGGGDLATTNGVAHVENWGDSGTSLTSTFRASWTGTSLVQLSYANGAGAVSTGDDCGVKRATVTRVADGSVVAQGYLVAPQTGDWSTYRDSSTLAAAVDAGALYTVVVDDDPFAVNMSAYALDAPLGAPFARFDVAGVKLLALTGGAAPSIALGGDNDYDLFPAAADVAPGVTVAAWDAFALSVDADFLSVAAVSSAFQTTTIDAEMIYVEADPSDTGTRPGLTYDGETATIPFPAQFVIAMRRQADTGDGTGPWDGLFEWTGASWTRRMRLDATDAWVSSDDSTLSARVPLAQLGAPQTTIRVAAHVIAGGGDYNDTVPATHAPWQSQTTGYDELDLASGAWTVK